jgi:BT4734-like, N-terminal domain
MRSTGGRHDSPPNLTGRIQVSHRDARLRRRRIRIHTIKNGKERKAIEDVRSGKRSKLTLPAVLWSGLFSARANDKLVKHSGLCVADLDTLNGDLTTVRRQLEGSKFAYAIYVSPGGNGLKAVFRIPADASRHGDSFRAIEKHVLELTGKQIDKSGKDPARLCFVSHDPDAYYNPDALELEPLPTPEKPKAVATKGALAPDQPLRERIATELLGPLSWSAEKGGYFGRCPGDMPHERDSPETHHCLLERRSDARLSA